MNTNHKLLFQDSRNLSAIKDKSINLTVTSPPYPMIQMWDDLFIKTYKNIAIQQALQNNDGNLMFELMHQELDKVWQEISRVTCDGGFVVINIGDATRKIGDYFQLYSNHTRITSKFIELGFDILPLILWKKTSNSPNKFMGSGMLPAGAYITLEHEYVLIFRKGHKREFLIQSEKNNRNESAFFWEERNIWFSNIWDLKGVKQNLLTQNLRKRSAAYTIELPYRIIQMYSCKGDTILDPFVGTGTTIFASAIAERNSIGIEIDSNFQNVIKNEFGSLRNISFNHCCSRIQNHLSFIENYKNKKEIKHYNKNHHFSVITAQEQNIKINQIANIDINENNIAIDYQLFQNNELNLH